MATATTHREKAEHNRQFLDGIDEQKFPDWSSAVAFYTALHVVESIAATTGIHHKGHTSRHQFLKTEHADLWRDYRPLFNLSLIARYGSKRMKPVHVEQAKLHLDRIQENAGKIRRSAN